MSAEVVRVTVEREELTASKAPALRALFGLERLPLAEARVAVELRGVPTAVVNALRRVLMDELLGRSLQVPPDGFDTELTTDSFMLPQFVNQRIALLPLRAQIPAEVAGGLRLRLDVANAGATPLSVYAGDLQVAEGAMPEPLFNPTFRLAVLQPGKRIVIRGIRIATGYGRDNAAFQVARRAAYTHLDLPQHTVEETHDSGGPAVDLSGYKVSSLVADPRHHRLSAVIPATAPDVSEVRAVLADACANIKERLRLAATAVERPAEAASGGPAHRGVQFAVIALEEGLTEGILQVPGETHTIGELLRRAVFDLAPEIANVSYTIVPHEGRLQFVLRHTGDVSRVLLGAIKRSIATFDILQQGMS